MKKILSSKRNLTIAGIVAVVLIIIIISQASGSPSDEGLASILDSQTREVETALVSRLSNTQNSLPLLGIVKSDSEATLRAEFPGQIIRTNYQIGQFTPAGAIIAEVDNASQRAVLLQAEGALEATQANYNKITKGVRNEQLEILQTQLENATKANAEAKNLLINSIKDTFSSADDVINNRLNSLFTPIDQNKVNPEIINGTANSQLIIDIEWQSRLLNDSLSTWQSTLKNLSQASDLESIAKETQNRLESIKAFLNLTAQAVNGLIATNQLPQATINGYKANVSASRTIISGSVSALISAQTGLNNSNAGLEIAKQQLEQGVTGGQPEDILAASAALKQARGAYNAALASFEKTVIRTPISGVLSNLSVDKGDFVSMFEFIALVSNQGGLEIVTAVTETDATAISTNTPAIINQSIPARVSSIAQSLNPTTKKIQVKLAIKAKDAEQANLINGQSVQVKINRDQIASSQITQIIIPISALKITATGPNVFTVNSENRLVANPIEEGAIIGEQIIVNKGLTPEMEIVVNARGLKENQSVVVR